MDFLMENCSAIDAHELMDDKVLSRACLKSLEIIGEASRNISGEALAGAFTLPSKKRILFVPIS